MNLRQLQQKRRQVEIEQDIHGKFILLTGRVSKYTRITIINKIKELGGIPMDKARQGVDIVVYTREDTQKYTQAKNISIRSHKKVIFVTGDEFVKEYLKME